MNEYLLYLGTAFGLILIIEGLLYALFTDRMRQMLATLLVTPPEQIRKIGFGTTIVGVILLFVIDKITG